MHHTKRTRAIVYIPPGVNVERWRNACYKHCARRSYEIVGLVIDPDGTKWRDVCNVTGRGDADVVVVFDESAMPVDRVPRIEEVGLESTGDIPRQRRPRLFRRPGNRNAPPPIMGGGA